MKKVFMGGFGVINTKNYEKIAPAFSFLSLACDYPTPELLEDEFFTEVVTNFPEMAAKEEFLEILLSFQAEGLASLKEKFTQLFELNKNRTLYCTYYRLEDSKERGALLAKLKMLYEMFGWQLEKAEYTDYLPTLLEFLSVADWQEDQRVADLQLAFSVVEDGTYELLKNSQDLPNEPYIRLMTLIRQVLRYVLTVEEVLV